MHNRGARFWPSRQRPNQSLHPTAMNFAGSTSIFGTVAAGEFCRSAAVEVVDEMVDELRVSCRRCRFRFPVEVAVKDAWRVEAQCPSCEAWACFSAADTQDLPRSDQTEREAEMQRLRELLWLPINEHRGHPTIAWMDRVGNGLFEDDYSQGCWPVPHFVYRFTRRESAAYIWQEGCSWFVRGWHLLQCLHSPPEPAEVLSFEAALNWLESNAEPF